MLMRGQAWNQPRKNLVTKGCRRGKPARAQHTPEKMAPKMRALTGAQRASHLHDVGTLKVAHNHHDSLHGRSELVQLGVQVVQLGVQLLDGLLGVWCL